MVYADTSYMKRDSNKTRNQNMEEKEKQLVHKESDIHTTVEVASMSTYP